MRSLATLALFIDREGGIFEIVYLSSVIVGTLATCDYDRKSTHANFLSRHRLTQQNVI